MNCIIEREGTVQVSCVLKTLGTVHICALRRWFSICYNQIQPSDVHAKLQNYTSTVVQGGRTDGWREPLPGVLDMLQDFETIFLLVESL